MFSIAIYSSLPKDVETLKVIIQDFLIETKSMAKVSCFNEATAFLMTPNSFDIYIMDMDSDTNVMLLGKQIQQIDTGSYSIYFSSDPSVAHLAARVRADYYLEKPFNAQEIVEVLKEIKQKIKEDSLIIKTACGERKIRVCQLNYIDIEKRCLCYHLADGTMFDGQVLRTSFEKAINPLHLNKAFLFIAPSLLINIGGIKIVAPNHLIFENDDVLYFPKKHYERVRETWIHYNRIFE